MFSAFAMYTRHIVSVRYASDTSNIRSARGEYVVHTLYIYCSCIAYTSNFLLDCYRLVIMSMHGNFIVLIHWETRPPAPGPDTEPTSPSLSQSAPRLSRKRQVYIFKSLVWLDQGPNLYQNGRPMLNSFGLPVTLKLIWYVSLQISPKLII